MAVKSLRLFSGKLLHEMILGTSEELREHAELMKKASDVEQAGANVVQVKPGAKTADGSFTTNLQAISSVGKRSVLVITAYSGPCNSSNNTYPALRQVQADARANGRDDFVGVQLISGSTHVDSEGKNTNLLGWIACFLQGQPQTANSTRLRNLTSNWATDMVTGKRVSTCCPGGDYLDGLVNTSVANVIR